MRLAFTVCLMDANIKHEKYSKKYPIIFGKNALKAHQIKNINQIPKKTSLLKAAESASKYVETEIK